MSSSLNLQSTRLMMAVALLLAAGCSASEEAAPPATASPSTPPAVSSPATATPTPSASPTCELFSPRATLAITASRWALVVASRGADDELTHIEIFADDVDELVEDMEDSGCSGTLEMVAAAGLGAEFAYLATQLRINPAARPPSSQYDAVADQGNALLAEFDLTGLKFIPGDCTGVVRETEECTAIG